MLTPFIRRQLWTFLVLTVVSLLVLGVYYLQVPSLMGIGRYSLKADLPASGGLYPTANVTYRGITIGKVTDVEPTDHLSFNFSRIEVEYRSQKPDGSLDTPVKAGWDVQANKKI